MGAARRTPEERERRELLARARTESPRVAATLEQLLADDARSRTRALDEVATLLQRDALDEAALEALPYLLALATSAGYREGSALLARLFALLASIDDPPRSGPADARASALVEAFRACAPRVLRHAHRASDPEAARIAACMCGRFPELDREVEPLLIALASGARDGEARARLLYALARIQAARGADFAPRIAAALHAPTPDAETVAVALALAEHDPPLPLRARLAHALRAAASAMPDPRSWGRTLDRGVLDRALARLAP